MINGRRYYQGSHVGYLPHVTVLRQQNADLPGGLQGSATSLEIGTINLFYLCGMENGPTPALFVFVKRHPTVDVQEGLPVVATVSNDTFKLGFTVDYDPQLHIMLHVDSIKGKYKLVPHHDKDLASEYIIGMYPHVGCPLECSTHNCNYN